MAVAIGPPTISTPPHQRRLRELVRGRPSTGMWGEGGANTEPTPPRPGAGPPPLRASPPLRIRFRPMSPPDQDQVQYLHETCFPVRYNANFFAGVVRGEVERRGVREPIYHEVAVVSLADSIASRNRDRGAQGGVETEGAEGDAERESGRHVWRDEDGGGDVEGGVEEGIVAVATGQLTALHKCEDRDRLGLGWPPVTGGRGIAAVTGIARAVSPPAPGPSNIQVMYILTLGTLEEYRRQGIGRLLLERLIASAKALPTCKAVYLHVLVNNDSAVAMYRALGFVWLGLLEDYYTIGGERHDCLIYALYINGASAPFTLPLYPSFQALSRRVRRAARMVWGWFHKEQPRPPPRFIGGQRGQTGRRRGQGAEQSASRGGGQGVQVQELDIRTKPPPAVWRAAGVSCGADAGQGSGKALCSGDDDGAVGDTGAGGESSRQGQGQGQRQQSAVQQREGSLDVC